MSADSSIQNIVPPPPKPGQNFIFKLALPALVVVGGLGLLVALKAAGASAEKGTPPPRVDLVETQTLAAGTARARVEASGTVVAYQQIVAAPEVAGRLVKVSNKLVNGGRFAKGEVMARVDARDYQVAFEVERSRVQQASLELTLEENRGSVAQREWQMIGDQKTSDGKLARREPHLGVAQANVEAARANMRRAELNVSRTAIRAPFNAIVLSENVDVGQVVGGASQVAVLAGTDQFRIDVSVPFDRLATLSIPGVDGAEEGSEAVIRQTLAGGDTLVRHGRIVGIGGQLDPKTRTATVLVTVDNPLDPPDGGLPLMIGAFVQVELLGRQHEDALTVPRSALYDGDTVWVVDDNDALARRTVTVGWSLSEDIEVSSGLEPGDRIVTTPLSAPVAGTLVKLRKNAKGLR
jgi:RND family efflux transporter MFP subunit